MPGPIPERSDRRRRVNKPEIEIESAPGAEDVEVPEPDPHWAPFVTRWYVSLSKSGQSIFYQPSDWSQAWILAEVLHRAMVNSKPSAMLIQSFLAGSSELMTTEGARRRLRIELARGQQKDDDAEAAVTAMDAYRKRLG